MDLNSRLFQRNVTLGERRAYPVDPQLKHPVIKGPIDAATADWLNKHPMMIRNRIGKDDGRQIRAGENICSYTDYIGQTTTQRQLMPGQSGSECPTLIGKSMADLSPSELAHLLRTGNCEVTMTDSDKCPLFITAKEAGYERFVNELTDAKNLNYNRMAFANDDPMLVENVYCTIGY